jgi:hypothetical protein
LAILLPQLPAPTVSPYGAGIRSPPVPSAPMGLALRHRRHHQPLRGWRHLRHDASAPTGMVSRGHKPLKHSFSGLMCDGTPPGILRWLIH